MSEQLGTFQGVTRDAIAFQQAAMPATLGTFYRANGVRIGLYDSASDAGNVALTTQVMTAVPIALVAGDAITNISCQAGATAAGTPTNYWFALYDSAATPNLLAQSADQTSTAWAAFAVKTLPLATVQAITKTGIYWVAIMVKATTVPTLMGSIAVKPVVTGERNLAVTSGAALTTTAPATLATPTVANFAPYVVLT
jgi:hypothetical protein